jgi:hypothetical protein
MKESFWTKFDMGTFAIHTFFMFSRPHDTFYISHARPLSHSLLSSFGTYRWVCGDTYEGAWVEGRMTGRGRKQTRSGDVTISTFVDGKARIHKYALTHIIYVGTTYVLRGTLLV